jgi:catechol 2,3-dioxygenase-like lactoylglutathione lyase family enzyme
MLRFTAAVPVLRIFDEAKACEFYLDFLGFKRDWEHRFEPGLPLYLQISRGGVILHLSGHHGDASPGALVRVPVAGLPHLLEELGERRYPSLHPSIERRPWGWDELELTDPFHNRLVFCEPAP